MSVFTPVSDAQARSLLKRYALGELEKLEGIAQGVENTNYFLTTTTGEYVLTLFEHIPLADLPFYVGLMDHLAQNEVICPVPMHMEGGGMIAEVNGKPAIIVSRLPGEPEPFPEEEECHIVGRVLAGIHVAAIEYDAGLENWRGREWRERFAEQVRSKVSSEESGLIDAENRYQALYDDTVLPQGIIHGDLFHDNVLWDEDGKGGVIDFYFACDDVLLYDVAIAVNDWCTNPDATLDHARTHAFVKGYESLRPLEDLEREMWPVMLRRAALRTWLGRLGYNHFPRDSHMTIPKDHEFSRKLLEHHVAHAHSLEDTL
jgi:homoserine kinase type II